MPAIPVTAIGVVPTAAADATLILMSAGAEKDGETVTGLGESENVTPPGTTPVTYNVTGPEKPFRDVTLMPIVCDVPCAIETLGFDAKRKSGVA